jgi:release factor glutamine methyltransferase
MKAATGAKTGGVSLPAAQLSQIRSTDTVAGIRRILVGRFRAAGLESPELDARILIGHALDCDHAALAGAHARRLAAAEREVIAAFAARRLAREPVARILGYKEFWSMRFNISAATLVPRPETETVVEAALAAIDAPGARAPVQRIADLGTGSGALLLALLRELPQAFGIGTDCSVAALDVARGNARRLGLERAAFLACDMAAAFGAKFDIVVCNPPYIRSDEIPSLMPEVRDFDPRTALDGGVDGLDYYRTLAAAGPSLLADAGALIVECGAGQAGAVAALFAAAGLAPAPPRTDLNGVPRAVIARKILPG